MQQKIFTCNDGYQFEQITKERAMQLIQEGKEQVFVMNPTAQARNDGKQESEHWAETIEDIVNCKEQEVFLLDNIKGQVTIEEFKKAIFQSRIMLLSKTYTFRHKKIERYEHLIVYLSRFINLHDDMIKEYEIDQETREGIIEVTVFFKTGD